MRLGVVVALAAEARTLGSGKCPPGRIDQLSESVAVCVSGVGPGRARAAARKLLHHGAEALLSWGTAAALVPGLEAGRVVLPRSILRPDESPLGVCERWRRGLGELAGRGLEVADAPLITVDRVLADVGEKRHLHAHCGAIAADMESSGVAAVAHEEQVPFAALRVIADGADADLPLWLLRCIDDAGRTRPSAWMRCLTHPGDWPALLRVSRDFRVALGVLRAVADAGGARYV